MLQMGAPFLYYKLGQMLLQVEAASLLQIGASVVTIRGSYYKLGEPLLQNKATILNWGKSVTNWGWYYKLEQLLQLRHNIWQGSEYLSDLYLVSRFPLQTESKHFPHIINSVYVECVSNIPFNKPSVIMKEFTSGNVLHKNFNMAYFCRKYLPFSWC